MRNVQLPEVKEQERAVQSVDDLKSAPIADCVAPDGDRCDAEGERQLETEAEDAPIAVRCHLHCCVQFQPSGTSY